jgi:hypothetical protein
MNETKQKVTPRVVPSLVLRLPESISVWRLDFYIQNNVWSLICPSRSFAHYSCSPLRNVDFYDHKYNDEWRWWYGCPKHAFIISSQFSLFFFVYQKFQTEIHCNLLAFVVRQNRYCSRAHHSQIFSIGFAFIVWESTFLKRDSSRDLPPNLVLLGPFLLIRWDNWKRNYVRFCSKVSPSHGNRFYW